MHLWSYEAVLGMRNLLTLPKTHIFAPDGWLEYDRFLLGWNFQGCLLLVSGRVYRRCFVNEGEKLAKYGTRKPWVKIRWDIHPRYFFSVGAMYLGKL